MKRVLIFSRQPDASPSIEGLLGMEPRLDILGWETDEERAVQRIREIGPDMVIITDQFPTPDCEPLVRRILDAGLGTSVVVLNLETNTVHVFGKEPRLFEDIKDLLAAIE